MNQAHLLLLETKIFVFVSYRFIVTQTGELDRPHNKIDYPVSNG